LDEAALDRCRALASYEKQGLTKGTNSCIVTLQYVVAGEWCERTVFVKQTADATAWEAAQYRLLTSHGVPTPELLVALFRNQAEVLVLEFLPTIGVDFQASDQVRALLQLVARLNAVAAEADPPTPGRGVPHADFDARVKVALSKVMLDTPRLVDADRWFAGYQRARDALGSMPRALSHGELYFQQVGWLRQHSVLAATSSACSGILVGSEPNSLGGPDGLPTLYRHDHSSVDEANPAGVSDLSLFHVPPTIQ
jgi:hypothetical protein